jgi:hypothetical protein
MPERWIAASQAIQALLIAVGDFDGPAFGAVEPRLDRRSLQFGIAGVHYPEHWQGILRSIQAMVPGSQPAYWHGRALRALPVGAR